MKLNYSHRMRPPRERVLAVDGGQVVCPRRGIVDLDMCWGCPAYRGLTTGPREGVICGTEPVFLSTAARWSGRPTRRRPGSRMAEMRRPAEDVP